MKIVKFISLSSSMLGFAVFPVVINDLMKTSIFMGLAVGTVSAFFLSTPFMLNWITKRYVLELHYDPESKIFTAQTYNIVNQIKEIKFKATDVTVPDLPGMLSSFLVNGKPLFVDANMIQDPDAYSHMMGYDKALDFTITEDDETSKSTKASWDIEYSIFLANLMEFEVDACIIKFKQL